MNYITKQQLEILLSVADLGRKTGQIPFSEMGIVGDAVTGVAKVANTMQPGEMLVILSPAKPATETPQNQESPNEAK